MADSTSTKILPVRTPQQVAAVRHLFRAYQKWLGIDLGFQNFEREVAALPEKYAPPSGELLLAYAGEEPLGCVALQAWPEVPHTAEMKRLFVVPEQRGHGTGERLIAEIIELARQLGYRHLRLDSMADRMKPAIHLYERFGFHQIAPYRHNPYPDALFLELDLNDPDNQSPLPK